MQSCLPAAPHTLYRVHCELGCVESGITARSSTAIMNCRDTLPGTYFITPLSLRQARKKQLQGCTGCSFALEKAPSFMWEVSNLRPSPLPDGPPPPHHIPPAAPPHLHATACSLRHSPPPLATLATAATHRQTHCDHCSTIFGPLTHRAEFRVYSLLSQVRASRISPSNLPPDPR